MNFYEKISNEYTLIFGKTIGARISNFKIIETRKQWPLISLLPVLRRTSHRMVGFTYSELSLSSNNQLNNLFPNQEHRIYKLITILSLI